MKIKVRIEHTFRTNSGVFEKLVHVCCFKKEDQDCRSRIQDLVFSV